MMRKYLLLLTIIAIVLPYQVLYADGLSPSEIVNQYFEARTGGNVDMIKNLITGPLYQTQKVLLEKNKDYPKFLKNHYAGTKITIEDSFLEYFDIIEKKYPILYERYQRFKRIDKNKFSITDNDQIAIVTTKGRLKDGSTFNTKFLLKYDSNHNWKIYDEILVR